MFRCGEDRREWLGDVFGDEVVNMFLSGLSETVENDVSPGFHHDVLALGSRVALISQSAWGMVFFVEIDKIGTCPGLETKVDN